MNKDEIIARIVDSFWDISGEDPEDYLDMEPINLKHAEMYLAEQRADERSAELDPEDCLPAETTPELYMEAENCYIRSMKHEAHIRRLADWLEENEAVCEYDNCRILYEHNDPEIYPVSFLTGTSHEFPFNTKDGVEPSALDLVAMGRRSPRFNPDHEYCWFDMEKEVLYSTNTPYRDEIIHAEPLARAILDPDNTPALYYILSDSLDEDSVQEIFHMDEAGVRKFYHLC